MRRKIGWIVAAAIVVLAAVLTWQLWPEDEPSFREELAGVAGVISVDGNSSSAQVTLPHDIELASLRSSVTELAALVGKNDSLVVFIGDVHFSINGPGTALRPDDPLRSAELAWAAAGVEDIVEGQVVTRSRERLVVELPDGAPLLDATDQVIDRLADESIELPAGLLDINRPAERPAFSEVRISGLTLAEAQARYDRVVTALQSSPGELLQMELKDVATRLKIEAPSLSDLVDVRRSVLKELGRDEVSLRFVAHDTEISRAIEHSPSAAIRLATQVQRTGATVTDIDAGLESISVQTPTPKVTQKVLDLMNTSSWIVRSGGRVRLELEAPDAYEDSSMTGDTGTLLGIGPTVLDVHRAGYRVTFSRGEVDDQAGSLLVSPVGITNGEPLADLTEAGDARELVDILRSGDWSGRMEIGIYGSSTIWTSFTSTADGPARKVRDSPNRPADQEEVAAGLAAFVKRWNASAG